MKFSRLIGAATLIASLGGVVLTAGCGGSGSGVSAPVKAATGRAVFHIQWPESTSRLVPIAATHLKIVLSNANGPVASRVIARPNSDTTFDFLAPGGLTVSATAYPDDPDSTADGNGAAQATATAPVTIVADTATTLNLTLASTIQSIDVSPATLALNTGVLGNTATLVATAKDSGGSIVLTNGTFQFTSGTPATATVATGTGLVTAVAPGTSVVTATETESGVGGTANVTVTAVGVSVSSPVSGPLALGGTRQINAAVTGAANTNVVWTATGPGGADVSGAVSSTGLFTAPTGATAAGIYTVRATSVADPTRSDTIAITVPTQVAITPASVVTIGVGESVDLAATVSGASDQSVTWQVVGSGAGSINASGRYTGPAAPGVYTVRATSVATPSGSATKTITVVSGALNVSIH